MYFGRVEETKEAMKAKTIHLAIVNKEKDCACARNSSQ